MHNITNLLYVVYDKVAKEAGPVFEAKNHGVAKRNYSNLLSKEGIFSDEYQLLCVGAIDKESNTVTGSKPEEIIIDLETETE